MYNAYENGGWEGGNPKMPDIIDPGGGLPNDNPGGSEATAGAGESATEEAVEETAKATGGWESVLEEYWKENPEELERAAEENPEAFGGDLNNNEEGVTWTYVGNGVFVSSDGERSVSPPHPTYGYDNVATKVGGSYDMPELEYADSEKQDTPSFDLSSFLDWTKGGENTGGWTTTGGTNNVDSQQRDSSGDNRPAGDNSRDTGGVGDDTTGDIRGSGTGTSSGDGPGDTAGDTDVTFDPSIALGLIPLLMGGDDKPEKTYTGGARPQDMTTLYEKPQYDDVTQKPRLEGQPMTLQAPMITPAGNSGQASYDEWLSDYLKSEQVQNGLLPMIAPKRKSRGLI
jgi:hypothetical protein